MQGWSNKALVKLSNNEGDHWTIDDAMRGVSIFGGTGSGKTTASGKLLAKQFLKEGWGGLVLCAKTDEADLWRQYCEETGREKDLLIFGKGSVHVDGKHEGEEFVFNPIDYEMKRSGEGAGETQNITNIFMNIYRMGNRIASEGDTKEERYWDTALKRCLNRTIELLKIAEEDLTYKNMVKVISSCENINEEIVLATVSKLRQNRSAEEMEGEDEDTQPEEPSYCVQCLAQAFINILDEDDDSLKLNAFDLAYSYFTQAMPNMGSRTKSVVTESFMGLAEPFLSGLLYRHFSKATNVYPEWTYEQNKIIVLNFPIKEYLEAGIMAQCVFKLLFQQAIERRNVKQFPTPVFLWADEAQYFVNPYDQIFLTTARSSRTATVFLSQNISNYFAVMGSGNDAKARVDSLMGNLSTKIFHANSDAETNEYSSRLIGNSITVLANEGSSSSSFNIAVQQSAGITEQYLPQVQPREFTVLRNGGENNNYQVDSIVFVTGKTWANKKNFIRATFTQEFAKEVVQA